MPVWDFFHQQYLSQHPREPPPLCYFLMPKDLRPKTPGFPLATGPWQVTRDLSQTSQDTYPYHVGVSCHVCMELPFLTKQMVI